MGLGAAKVGLKKKKGKFPREKRIKNHGFCMYVWLHHSSTCRERLT